VRSHPAFSDPGTIAGLIAEIERVAADIPSRSTFMEVCGTHTHAVAAAGLRRLLPKGVRLISGPGCPVCVTSIGYMDRAVALAHRPATVVCTFGDLIRVPSSTSSLERARAEGGAVEVVYSPRDALDVARSHTGATVVFLAVGFETTTPTIAAALAEAGDAGLDNLLILPGNKVMPPPMESLVADSEIEVHGFLLPGHVSIITGWRIFEFLAQDHGVSGTVVGFEPADVLRGVLALLKMRVEGRPAVANLYGRAVTRDGNPTAHRIVRRFFEPADEEWRGFGTIPLSGLALRPEWSHLDASTIPLELPPPVEPPGCRCGDVLRGLIDPSECPLFADPCTPDNPVGACMVSSEGSCAAWYRHERWAADGGTP